MLTRFPKFAIGALVLFALAVPSAPAKKKSGTPDTTPKRVVHALNRLTFGPRPGDVQQVMAMGVDKWIDLQLHPEKIKDSAIEARLEPLRTLRMSPKELAENFPDRQMVREVMDGKKSMPSDPARRAVYQVQIARMQERRERKVEAAAPTASLSPEKRDPGSPVEGPAASTDSMSPMESKSRPKPDSNAITGTTDSENQEASNPTPNPGSAGFNEMQPPARDTQPQDDAEARRREDRLYSDLEAQQLLDLSPGQRYKKVLAMSVDQQVALADSLRGGKLQEFVVGMDPRERETILAMNNPTAVVAAELAEAKLLRAIYSERQLEEVMTDFWFNHFNVYIGKGADRLLVTGYEQDVIRPHALGKFEDLLVATAKSPAMLFYLDNWLSVGPNSLQASGALQRPMRRRAPYGPYGRRYPRRMPSPNAQPRRKQSSGLNENYGRELLELHTLSVNGGYSQRDVTEVAKVFTGWTIAKPFEGGGFRYEPLMHEPGPKFVMGHRIKPRGEDEGREVLHRLATSPETAHFISLKLAQRFVSDDPPPALVDRMAKTFLKKKGDIREVLTTLFQSPEFWADDAYRAKVKTPLEFIISSIRATGAEVGNPIPLIKQLNDMGMPLYGAQPPTGYSMKTETWVNSSALLNRMNFAVNLASGKLRGIKADPSQILGSAPSADGAQTLSILEGSVLAGDVSKQTHDSIVVQIDASSASADEKMNSKSGSRHAQDASTITGLLLGSPEFQRR